VETTIADSPRRRGSDIAKRAAPRTPTTKTPKTPIIIISTSKKRSSKRRGSTGSALPEADWKELYGASTTPIGKNCVTSQLDDEIDDDAYDEQEEDKQRHSKSSKSSPRRGSRSKSTPRKVTSPKTPNGNSTPRKQQQPRHSSKALDGLRRVAAAVDDGDSFIMLPPLIQLTPEDNQSIDIIVSLDDSMQDDDHGRASSKLNTSRPPRPNVNNKSNGRQNAPSKASGEATPVDYNNMEEENDTLNESKCIDVAKQRSTEVHFLASLGNTRNSIVW
jgi:hypothetical protein